MQFFPLFQNLQNSRCLFIGGGKVASRKAKTLLHYGIIIDVISPNVLTALEETVEVSKGKVIREVFSSQLIQREYHLIIATTNNTSVNAEVAHYAKSIKTPVNVTDNLSLCDFIFPAIIDRNPMTIAITNNGASPILSKILKQTINQFLPDAFGDLSKFIGAHRQKVKSRITDSDIRITFWQQLLQGAIAETIFSGNLKHAEKMLDKALENPLAFNKKGQVYLIGAGPGDPDLLTLRAFRLLQQADVIVYDRLVSEDVMALIAPNIETIYVGKKRDNHSVQQEDITQMLVDLSKQGKRVARLKGGDPFIFGRGGEEIEGLVDHSVDFQVVPGITAASGCSAYAGIPLTHRDYAQSVQFVTGQLKDGSIDLDWKELIVPNKTLVFYMGLSSLPLICKSLINNGMEKTMPLALIEKGTTQSQRVFISSLDEIADVLSKENVESPSLLIVGNVVKLANKLNWV